MSLHHVNQPFLTWGDRGSVSRFQGVCVLVLSFFGGGKPLNSNLGLHVIMNVGNKVICGLLSPEMFVDFNKSHYLYLINLNTFFREGICRFNQTLRGVHGTKH